MISIFYIFLIVSTILYHSVSLKEKDDFPLTIVHFNDFHARFEETSFTSTKCEGNGNQCIGGFPRLYTQINDIKKKTPDAIVLNAGDDFQGTLWYNILRWNVTQHFMNMLPIDVYTIGNHEFDDGIKGVAPYLASRTAPIVVSNIDDSLEPQFQGLYNKSIVIERNGRKIGIIGVISEETHTLSSTEKLIFTDEVEAVKSEAQKLTDSGIDIIIVLSHCGLASDRKIAREAGSNIDIIVGGHSHSLLYNGKPPNGIADDVYPIVVDQIDSKVLIVQASAYTKYLGNLNVVFDSLGRVKSWDGNPIYLDKTIKEDKDILELMKPFKEEIDAVGKKEVGKSKVALKKGRCAYGECNLGNFINDAFVDYFIDKSEDDWTYASVSLMNQGGIRTDIPKGVITYEDLVLALPFANSIHTFNIKGKYILESLEYAVEELNENYAYKMLQVSGLHIVYNFTNPAGARVDSVSILCAKCEVPVYQPLEMETSYRISTQSFLATGGDGFSALAEHQEDTKIWEVDLDVLQKFIEKRGPIVEAEDGRMVVLN